MLINSKLFNYSSLKPWHFKPINTVAEGRSPDAGPIVWCPHFCVLQLCYCWGWPPAVVIQRHQTYISFFFMKWGTVATSQYHDTFFPFHIVDQNHSKYKQKWLSILREKESTCIHTLCIVCMQYPDATQPYLQLSPHLSSHEYWTPLL